MILRRLTETLAIVSMAMCLLLAPSLLNSASASRIVAVVNRAVITDFDIGQRQRLERLLSGGKKRMGRTATLNLLIDDKLKLLEARERSATASDAEVTAAMKNMAANVRMSQKQMLSIFRRAGINKQTVSEWLKVQISWRNMISARFNAQVRVEEAEIVRALSKNKGKSKTVESTVQFDLTQITFIASKNASKRTKSNQLALAKKFRTNFKSCKTDLVSARRLADVAVSRIGRRQSNELPPALVKKLRTTSINALTTPTKVANGYEMLAVCGKKDLGTSATLRNEAESKLKDERGRTLSRKYLRELRAKAIIEKR